MIRLNFKGTVGNQALPFLHGGSLEGLLNIIKCENLENLFPSCLDILSWVYGTRSRFYTHYLPGYMGPGPVSTLYYLPGYMRPGPVSTLYYLPGYIWDQVPFLHSVNHLDLWDQVPFLHFINYLGIWDQVPFLHSIFPPSPPAYKEILKGTVSVISSDLVSECYVRYNNTL